MKSNDTAITVADVTIPSQPKRAFIQLLAVEKGDELSWIHFIQKKYKYANLLEKKLGLTVHLTDTITNIVHIATKIDPTCTIAIEWLKGFLFPEFNLVFKSKKYELEISKHFAGGSSKDSVFNYEITMNMYSIFREYVELILNVCKGRIKRDAFYSDI